MSKSSPSKLRWKPCPASFWYRDHSLRQASDHQRVNPFASTLKRGYLPGRDVADPDQAVDVGGRLDAGPLPVPEPHPLDRVLRPAVDHLRQEAGSRGQADVERAVLVGADR